ncbi:hypothetical protein F2P81_018362 [Scophthalmus maximus]|uniref:Uncharacterized protein n=1 Tax=Scophthalmus maximus TaxID=52904 RepID=A0A6A4S815_SCOMX|nr:hypothetical protein F2P81_018362 [Scophthalmus maximus]
MPIRTLVSYVATAVGQVVRSILQHFLPLDKSRDEPVSPEEAVRNAAVKLKEIGVPGQHLCIIAHVFKVARDTCDSAAVLKAAAAAFNTAAALEEIGIHASLLNTVANVCNDKADLSEDQNNPLSRLLDLYNNIWASEAAAPTEPTEEAEAAAEKEPADVLIAAAALFKAAAVLEDLFVSAPVLSTMADVFNVAKDSGHPAAVLTVAAAVFSALAREEVRATRGADN